MSSASALQYRLGAYTPAKNDPHSSTSPPVGSYIVITAIVTTASTPKYDTAVVASEEDAKAVSLWVRREAAGGDLTPYAAEKAAHDAVATINTYTQGTKRSVQTLVVSEADLLKNLPVIPVGVAPAVTPNADLIGKVIPSCMIEYPSSSGNYISVTNAKVTQATPVMDPFAAVELPEIEQVRTVSVCGCLCVCMGVCGWMGVSVCLYVCVCVCVCVCMCV